MTRTEIEELVAEFDRIVRTGNMRASTALLPLIIHGMLDMIEQGTAGGPVSYGDTEITESVNDDSDDYESPVGYDPEAAHALIERINATPERHVYKIDVGDMPPEEAAAVVTEMQKQYGSNVELPDAFNNAEEAHKGAAIEYAAKMLEASEHRDDDADSKAKPKPKAKK